jgi:hypothetical protein
MVNINFIMLDRDKDNGVKPLLAQSHAVDIVEMKESATKTDEK